MARKNKFKGEKSPSGNQSINTQPSKKRKVGNKSQADDKVELPVETKTTVPQPLETRRKPGEVRHSPAPPPPSVSASHTILPPEADDAKLRNNHDLHSLSVYASSKIESKVRQVLSALRSSNEDSGEGDAAGKKKPTVVALTARAPAGNKCISVAEIAKRDMSKSGRKCWQYTGCWSRVETLETKSNEEDGMKSKESELVDGEAQGEEREVGEEEEESHFQTLEIPERNTVRTTVCLIIYLSAEPVARLKEIYGEQVTDAKKT
jgi:hypothetical protein